MRVLLFLAILLEFTSIAFANCESKPAGEMLQLLDSSDPHYLLDYDGVQKFSLCKADIINKKFNGVETAEAVNVCKKQALRYAFYDANPKSKDRNRKLLRAHCAAEPGVVEDANTDTEAK